MTFDANEFWAGNLIVQHHTNTQQHFQNITRVTMTYENKLQLRIEIIISEIQERRNRTIGH